MISRGFVVLVLVGGALGCGGKKSEVPAASGSDSYTLIVADSADFSKPTQFDKSGLGLRAVAKGDTIILSAERQPLAEGAETGPPIAIGPPDLALIMGPERADLVMLDRASIEMSKFTLLQLNPGERRTTTIKFWFRKDLGGTRLVYNNPRQNIRFPVSVE